MIGNVAMEVFRVGDCAGLLDYSAKKFFLAVCPGSKRVGTKTSDSSSYILQQLLIAISLQLVSYSVLHE